MLICRLHVDVRVHFLKLYLKTVSLDYIPEPASSIPIKKPPAAGTLEVMADVHKGFYQEGNQATQF